MERGLLWLPLLVVFIGLAWSGWNEYQKVEAYQTWAENFDKAKYDIYAVLGLRNGEMTWGKPTRKGPIALQTFSLNEVESIQLVVDEQAVDMKMPPAKGKAIALQFLMKQSTDSVQVPFTEISLASQWGQYLQQELKKMQVS